MARRFVGFALAGILSYSINVLSAHEDAQIEHPRACVRSNEVPLGDPLREKERANIIQYCKDMALRQNEDMVLTASYRERSRNIYG